MPRRIKFCKLSEATVFIMSNHRWQCSDDSPLSYVHAMSAGPHGPNVKDSPGLRVVTFLVSYISLDEVEVSTFPNFQIILGQGFSCNL